MKRKPKKSHAENVADYICSCPSLNEEYKLLACFALQWCEENRDKYPEMLFSDEPYDSKKMSSLEISAIGNWDLMPFGRTFWRCVKLWVDYDQSYDRLVEFNRNKESSELYLQISSIFSDL